MARLLAKDANLPQAELARRLGVNRATICRDVAKLRELLADARLGGIDALGFWWTLYVERRAEGNAFGDIFGCGNRCRFTQWTP